MEKNKNRNKEERFRGSMRRESMRRKRIREKEKTIDLMLDQLIENIRKK